MLIIWRGFGFLVLAIPFAINLIIELIDRGFYDSHIRIILALNFMVSAAILWVVGNKLNNQQRVLFDPATQQDVILKPNHALFFIKMQYWALIMVIAALWAFFNAS